MRGPTNEVIKAYEQFIRELDERRLSAKNRKLPGVYDAFERDSYLVHPDWGRGLTSQPSINRYTAPTNPQRQWRWGCQDGDPSQAAFVQLDGSGWTKRTVTEKPRSFS